MRGETPTAHHDAERRRGEESHEEWHGSGTEIRRRFIKPYKLLEKCRDSLNRVSAETRGSSKIGELRSRIRSIANRLCYIGMYCAVGLAIAGSDHLATRYSVTEVMHSGDRRFIHEDEETTLALDYLSGRAAMPDRYMIRYRVSYLRKLSTEDGISLPNNVESLDGPGLDSVYRRHMEAWFRQKGIDPGLVQIRRTIPTPPNKFEFRSELYRSIWKIEAQAGNPKVRLLFSSDRSVRQIAQRMFMSGEARAHYNPATNTILIPMDSGNQFEDISSYLAEAAHGVQWSERPLEHDLIAIRDRIETLVLALRHNEAPSEVVDTVMYEMPGSIENEAHHKIEPELRSELTGKE